MNGTANEFKGSLEGLSCPSCAAKIESVLKRTEGVSDATVAFTTGRVKVQYDPAVTNEESIAGVINRFGYKLTR